MESTRDALLRSLHSGKNFGGIRRRVGLFSYIPACACTCCCFYCMVYDKTSINEVFDFLNLESLWSHLESLWSHLESLGKNVRISPFHYGENADELELPTEFLELWEYTGISSLNDA